MIKGKLIYETKPDRGFVFAAYELLDRFDKKGRNSNIKVKYNKEDLIERLNKASKQHFKMPKGLKEESVPVA